MEYLCNIHAPSIHRPRIIYAKPSLYFTFISRNRHLVISTTLWLISIGAQQTYKEYGTRPNVVVRIWSSGPNWPKCPACLGIGALFADTARQIGQYLKRKNQLADHPLATANSNPKRLPSPMRLLTQMVPPWASINSLEMARPRPVPLRS